MKSHNTVFFLAALAATLTGCDKNIEAEKKVNNFFQPYTEKIPAVDAEKLKPVDLTVPQGKSK